GGMAPISGAEAEWAGQCDDEPDHLRIVSGQLPSVNATEAPSDQADLAPAAVVQFVSLTTFTRGRWKDPPMSEGDPVDRQGGGRPVPLPDEITAGFWDSIRSHRLSLQRCATCSRFNHPPILSCRACG